MSYPRFVDVSVWNDPTIDWQKYKAWSAQWDGKSRVCMRVSYGNGYEDQHYRTYRQGAERAGIDMIIYYHYSYPQFNSAAAEADWYRKVLGDIRVNDVLMLDFEENNDSSTPSWALAWLQRIEANYRKFPCIYSYTSMIRSRMNDVRLTRYPLFLANWTFDPNILPACPPPWGSYALLQYSDKEVNIPGIDGKVDADIYIGGYDMSQVPSGWRDNGKELYSPPADGIPEVPVVLGFRQWVLNHSWPADNLPLGPEYHVAHVDESDNNSPAGQVQLFRYDKLAYDDKNGVRLMRVGSELVHLLVDRDNLVKQVAQLRAGLPITDIRAGLAVIDKTVDDIGKLLP